MKLRTILLAGVLLVVALIVAGTVTAVTVLVPRAARAQVTGELASGRAVFDDLQAFRRSLFRSETLVVTEEPRLKAVTASEEISHATVLGVARELQTSLSSDLFLLVDPDAHLIVDVANPDAAGELVDKPEVRDALAKDEAAGVWVANDRAYQVQARKLAFGANVVGVLVIGYELDSRVAETVHRQTGDAVVILLGDRPIALSHFDGDVEPTREDVKSALPGAGSGEVVVAGEHYLATGAAFPGYHGTADLKYVILRSLDHALAPGRALAHLVYVISAIGLLAAALLAFAVSRRLVRPVDALVAFTRVIASGDLSHRAKVAGPREIATLGTAMNAMATQLAESRDALASKERLEREMEIAAKIQTSILPRDLAVAGLEFSARMRTASEVGGDYYDVVPVAGGCWIGIGDVAGHGLSAGIVMLMMQSAVSALAGRDPDAPPSALVNALNVMLHENIRNRLRSDEHVTATLLRYRGDGRLTFAGAHEEMFVLRADSGTCERVATPGTWLGAKRDIASATVDGELQLRKGDALVLYTDGVTEAMNGKHQQFGDIGLIETIEKAGAANVDALRDAIFAAVDAWAPDHADDITVLVLRYVG